MKTKAYLDFMDCIHQIISTISSKYLISDFDIHPMTLVLNVDPDIDNIYMPIYTLLGKYIFHHVTLTLTKWP